MESQRWWRRRWRWSLSGRERGVRLQTCSSWGSFEPATPARAHSGFLFAELAQDCGAAGRKADHGRQSCNPHGCRAEAENIGDDGRHGEDEPDCVDPERGANLSSQVSAKTKLKQESSEPDGRHHHQGKWTGERATAGVDHDQSQCEKEQARGNDGPAARLRRGRRIGRGWQGSSQVIQGRNWPFQFQAFDLSDAV